MGHAISFNIMLNGRETVIILQNSHYLAQPISEGIRLSMNNFMNHVWVNNILHPVASNSTPNITQMMMGEWNLPPHFVPIQNTHLVMDLPLFTPEIVTSINPIFTPWNVHATQAQPPHATAATPIKIQHNLKLKQTHQIKRK